MWLESILFQVNKGDGFMKDCPYLLVSFYNDLVEYFPKNYM